MIRLVQDLGRRWIAAAAVAVLGLAACDNDLPRMAPSASLYADTTAVIGIATAPLPPARTYRQGKEGLIDVVINDAVADQLNQRLATLDLSQFRQLRGDIAKKLEARGLQVRILEQPVNPDDYPKRSSGNDDKFADHDYAALRASAGIDRLLLLQLRDAGSVRNYFGFVAISDAKGYARVSGQMIDLRNSGVLWSGVADRTRDPDFISGGTLEMTPLDLSILAAIHAASTELSDDLAF